MKEYLEHFPNFSAEEYRALLNAISDDCLVFIKAAMEYMMPDKHASASTLNSIIVRIATKAICSVCENDQEARQKGIDFFCEALSDSIKKVITLRNADTNKNKH